jgi:hypothetical protein
MSTFASLISVHLAGEGKDEIALDTLPGKFTITRTDEALTPYGGLAACGAAFSNTLASLSVWPITVR